MARADQATRRLFGHRLSRPNVETPAEVVAWLGAVQSQEYLGACWSLGLRMSQARERVIEKAFNDGAILRTHVLRPTWHFVHPADIRWLLKLTAPRIQAGNAFRSRQLGLDDSTYRRSDALIARALEGGQHLTREEIGAAIERAGISVEGQRLPYLLMHAELEVIIYSGPRVGRQMTYSLLEERVPTAPERNREEALAELARRYFTSHGPATAKDFAWWSGLTVADARAGVAMNDGALAQAEIDGQPHWFAADLLDTLPGGAAAYLLPTYDEFLVGYAGFDRLRRGGDVEQSLAYSATLVIDGLVAGSWKRTLRKREVLVEVAPFAPLDKAERAEVESAARRYGEFLGLSGAVMVEPQSHSGG